MEELKKILVPTDFSDPAISAYTHAQALAAKYGAKVDFIHVVPTLKYFSQSISKLGVPLDDAEEDFYPQAQKEAEHRLRQLMEDYISEENRGEVDAKVYHKAWEVIADQAEKGGYDLIVMASRGEHESELLRGGNTEKVIRHSNVPVFTVDQRLSPEGLNRILVPTDASMISFYSLPLAMTLATTYDAEIVLFHVVELYGSLSESIPRQDPGKSEKVNIYENILDRITDFLIEHQYEDIQIRRGEVNFEDQFVITDGASSRSIRFKTVVEKAVSAHYAIEEYAPDHADAIVMATHGHSGLAHFFLGSTTEQVARHVGLPVLTIKPTKEEMDGK